MLQAHKPQFISWLQTFVRVQHRELEYNWELWSLTPWVWPTLERQLDPDVFRRIHRSVLVNADRVREVHRWFHGDSRLRLQDGTELTFELKLPAGVRRFPGFG